MLLSIFTYFSVANLFSDSVEGLWKSIDEKTGKVTAVWKIYTKESKLFGEILVAVGKNPNKLADKCTGNYPDFPKAGKVSQMPLVGTPFIFNLEKKSEGAWHNLSLIHI